MRSSPAKGTWLFRSVRYLTFALLFLAFLLRLTAARMPVLGTWDERFHALVAKNLIEHPLEPTMYDQPVLAHDYKVWSQTHIYLEKPPLPMWLMAISIYCFGPTEWAVRLPSILFSTLSVLLTFLIGRRLFNQRVGLYAAFFHAIHGMTLELVGGRISNDHVDVIFLFFLEWGLYAVITFFDQHKATNKRAIVIGVLTGLAFMCKWISAGFIPIIWGVLAIGYGYYRYPLRFLRYVGLMTLAFTAVSLPWLWYIWETYPEESGYTLARVFMRLGQSIEFHQHPWYFFIDHARMIFGEWIYLPLLWLLYQLYRKPRRKRIFTLVILIFVPLLLMSIMDTKRSPYILICAPGFFLLTAFFIHYYINIKSRLRLPSMVYYSILILMIGLPVRYGMERLKPFATYPEEFAVKAEILHTIEQLPSGKKVVFFNASYPIRTMFYGDVTAYERLPKPEVLHQLTQQDYQVFIQKEGTVISFPE